MKTKPRPLTANMIYVLELIARGQWAFTGCRGRSEMGGRDTTLNALVMRRLIRYGRRHGAALYLTEKAKRILDPKRGKKK